MIVELRGSVTPSAVTGVREREEIDDGSGSDLDGWFCLKVPPYRCSCGASIAFLSWTNGMGDHRVVVWPDFDDPTMKKEQAKVEGSSVVPYERAMGRCISFYAATPS